MRKKYYLTDLKEFKKLKFEDGLENIFLFSRKPKVPHAVIKIKILKYEPRYYHERKKNQSVFKYKCEKIMNAVKNCFNIVMEIIKE